jgi:hypothetical protein
MLLPVAILPFAGCSRSPAILSYEADWDFAESMLTVAQKYTGSPGVVLHIGDSNTFEPAYSAWALRGEGKTTEDVELLDWMHAGKGGAKDGWTLCSLPTHPRRSATAANGARLSQFLTGEQVDYSLDELVRRYNPQVVVLMLGTNEATIRLPTEDYGRQLRQAADLFLRNGTVPIMTTLPPHARRPREIEAYNREIQTLAREKRLPLIDLYGEILRRQPHGWKGTMIQEDGLHLTTTDASGAMQEEKLNRSGQLLRAWLTIRQLAVLKARVLDNINLSDNHAK